MIQRVQSIWLLLATLTLISLLFLPLITKNVDATAYSIYTNGLHQKTNAASGNGLIIEPFLPLMIANIALAAICFFNIFAFKNRSAQKRIAAVSIVLVLVLAGWSSVYGQHLPGGLTNASVGSGAILLLLAIIFCALAIRGIRKDEQLLRSADRLR
ncbi:DUF4293 domain-containing protein [Pedobacter sp. MC2016-24]|uniref:DUF4293 domain-containing protein n=1 Tax=Pedobacter sp. MC2016-24 TaxID=2780090 RepID=UPI00188030F5|nr:DUF4293 domain-containing protein [Pedobacter sp. MC2016-24]MBE9599254.1 DUF4293 domain-containing protein [Pedobacter sp. MC2016-24]